MQGCIPGNKAHNIAFFSRFPFRGSAPLRKRAMAPLDGIETLTVETVRNVLEEIIEYEPSGFWGPRVLASFVVPPWHGKWTEHFAAEDRRRYLVNLCGCFRTQAEDPETHLINIEALLIPLLECRVTVQGIERGIVEDDIALRTWEILKRLPSRPLELIGAPNSLDKGYFQNKTTYGSRSPVGCFGYGLSDSLQVTASLSTNIIKMTLYIVTSRLDAFGHSLQDYPNLLAELLETSSGLTAQCASDSQLQQWYIVRAALWSSWQRSVMLYLFASFRDALERGWSDGHRINFNLRGTVPAPGVSIQEMSNLHAAEGKARSMCSWAFELLRTETVCLGMDFRTFHQRYLKLWSNAPARCQKGSSMPCAGKDPDGCWRFKGMTIEDQSMHDSGCSGFCQKLQWDESSYRSALGARAVVIAREHSKAKEDRLKYCGASENTLAISHVWSHGQGGRPHEGVNRCLHWRYTKIAEDLGCDSYWWDSACIPEDHVLRSEAIQNINSTFSKSKVTLVCDRDIMRVDIADLTLGMRESILATVLVCDWNLRAWTFLESIRGRHQIHLLCKDNRTISFFEVVEEVFNHGSIDLAILGMAVPHMLPEPIQIPAKGISGPLVYAGIKRDNRDTPPTFMSREEGGEILSYRPASRMGDDVVIWSLLVNEDKCDSPEELWRSKLGKYIHTGFLMSSAPRLDSNGLSWAPSTPFFKPLPTSSTMTIPSFRAFSGRDSHPGIITEKGLVADWLVYEFNVSELSKSDGKHAMIKDPQAEALHEIWLLYLQSSKWGALIIPQSNHRTFEQDGDISTKYRGLIRGTLMAVLGCNSLSTPSQKLLDRGWKWKGIFEWDKDIPLPDFVEQSNFLIE